MFAEVHVPPGTYSDTLYFDIVLLLFLTASQFGVSESKALALNDIQSKIGPANILAELSSSLTFRYTAYRGQGITGIHEVMRLKQVS